jgi:acyl dehydratase
MPIIYDDLISRRVDDRPMSYIDTQILLYNLSIGMGHDPANAQELPFVFEQPALKAVPSAATVLGMDGLDILAGVDLDWLHVLHGEQRLIVHRPLPPAADLLNTSYVAAVTDKGAAKGAIITIRSDVRLVSGEPLYAVENVMFARANGGFGGPSQSADLPFILPKRAPDIVHITQTRPDQALIYRLNGDRNPLHAAPDFAKKAGFPAPIMHGMCGYGIACRAVLATICNYDVSMIKQFGARFTAPAFPGETIETDIWVDSNTVSFRCRVYNRDVTFLDNGRCIIGI